MFYIVLVMAFLLGYTNLEAQTKVYKGTSTYSSDIIATIKNGKVYTGTSSYSSDIQFTIDGYVTIEEFIAIWHAVKYSY